MSVDAFAVDVTGAEDLPELAQHAAAFQLELFELRREEDHLEGEFFEDLGFGFRVFVDDELVAVAVGEVAEEIGLRFEACRADVVADAFADEGVDAALANGADEVAKGSGFTDRVIAALGPCFDFFDVEKSGADAVGEIVERVGRVVGPVHHLALD